MAKSLENIKQDLATLEETTANLAVELGQLYRRYLDLLQDSLQKQLILAGYQICTQTYPETFLTLSVSQRQNLQKKLREAAKNLAQELCSLLPNLEEDAQETTTSTSVIPSPQFLSFQRDISTTMEEQKPENLQSPSPDDQSSLANSESCEVLEPLFPRNPNKLVEWYQNLEKRIYQLLESLSKKVNHLLHEGGILPSRIPLPLLDMAIESHEGQEVVSGPPNILNLLVEVQNQDESQEPGITKITAVRLKLSEIEFADPLLSSQRNQIHNLLPRLNTLRQQYQKKQQEKSIVEAELAWRACWYEG